MSVYYILSMYARIYSIRQIITTWLLIIDKCKSGQLWLIVCLTLGPWTLGSICNSVGVYKAAQCNIHPILSNLLSPNSRSYCHIVRPSQVIPSFRVFLRLTAKNRVDEATIHEIGSVRLVNYDLTFSSADEWSFIRKGDSLLFIRFKTETPQKVLQSFSLSN